MHRYAFLTLLLLANSLFSFAPTQWRIVQEWKKDLSQIAVLENNSGQKRLLKVVLDEDIDEQSILLIDEIAARIAATCNLPVNKVELIPAHQSPYQRLATLHEWASGTSIEDKLPWQEFTLQQRFRHPDSWYYAEFGPLPEKKQGLTRSVLQTMAHHPDLCRIAALDTFLGNADRSAPNLYYDESKNAFFGIDLGGSFRSPLAQVAEQQLFHLVKEGISTTEAAALQLYLQTLEQLCQSVDVETVSGWCQGQAQTYGLEKSKRLNVIHQRWADNYTHTLRLIAQLQKI